MDKLDLASELEMRGVDSDAAQRLKANINGNDLMDLISMMELNDPRSQKKVQLILGKYGIKLGVSDVASGYLGAKFESIREGGSLDSTFGGVMRPINEGFTYAVEVTEQTRDKVLDWLDENQVAYQATSPVSYQVECGDRDVAYRTGRAISNILRKPTVRDSLESVEEAKKSPNRRVKDAKDKMANAKPRNPVVAAVKTRGGAGAHDGGKDPRKVDKLGRDAKHKPRFDEQIEMDNLNEGAMAMNNVNPLFRLRELAGLPKNTLEDDFQGIEVADAPEIDPKGMLSAGPVVGDSPTDLDVDGIGSDPVAAPMDDMDGGMDAPTDTIPDIDDGVMPDSNLDVSDMVDPQAGVPGAIGSDPVDALPGIDTGMADMAPSQSDAMAQIEDALNSIQTGLADIRLSEYKSLIKKLQDLTNQAQMMGRDYLGERRKK